MVLDYHAYTLHVATPLNERSDRRALDGLLIREDGGVGCIHPWPELGDLPVQDQLDALRVGRDTPLIKSAKACLALDARWRRHGQSAFDDRTIPESHATLVTPSLALVEAAKASGFRTVKLKGSLSTLKAVQDLLEESPLPMRLDFNESLTVDDVCRFVDGLSVAARVRLEFIEDPCPFDPNIWQSLHDVTGCSLALDRQADRAAEGGFQVLVVKPAIDDLAVIDSISFVVTSYMDHPIGQLHAAYQASVLAERFPQQSLMCGLATHGLFEDLSFANCLGTGPRLQSPGGTGLGFDTYLEELPWKTL